MKIGKELVVKGTLPGRASNDNRNSEEHVEGSDRKRKVKSDVRLHVLNLWQTGLLCAEIGRRVRLSEDQVLLILEQYERQGYDMKRYT